MEKKIFRTLIGIVIIYIAVAVAIKAGLGVLPVDAAITTDGIFKPLIFSICIS